MRLIFVKGLWIQVRENETPQNQHVVDTLHMTAEDAQILLEQLAANSNAQLMADIMDERERCQLFPHLRGQEEPAPRSPVFVDAFYSEKNQAETSALVERQETVIAQLAEKESDSESEGMETEDDEQLIARYKQEIQQLNAKIKAIDVHLYARFLKQDEKFLATQTIQTWSDGISTLKRNYHNAGAYITALTKTKGVCLHTYKPYDIYPFSYTGAKDPNECGFIAEIMRKACPSPSTRLVEPFVGGARVFLACDFTHNIIADLDPALFAFYKIVQMEPDFADHYCADIKKGLVSFGGSKGLFDVSMQFLNTTTDIQFLLSNNHGSETRKDWARSYIYARNRGVRPQITFGKAKGTYKAIQNEAAYQQSEQEALQVLSHKLRNNEVTIKLQDWKQTFEMAGVGDIIYADPPYVEFSITEGIQKTPGGWTFLWDEHVQLAQMASQKAKKGTAVFISNYATPEILKLYQASGASRIYTYCWKTNGTFVCLAAFLPR